MYVCCSFFPILLLWLSTCWIGDQLVSILALSLFFDSFLHSSSWKGKFLLHLFSPHPPLSVLPILLFFFFIYMFYFLSLFHLLRWKCRSSDSPSGDDRDDLCNIPPHAVLHFDSFRRQAAPSPSSPREICLFFLSKQQNQT